MERTRKLSAGLAILLVLNAAVAANEVSRLFEDLLSSYCEDSDEASCREGLTDAGTLLTNVLRRKAGLKDLKSTDSILQQILQEGSSLVEIQCDFNFASYPIPVPYLCDWPTENNDAINWEPADFGLNLITKEPGPFTLSVYAISRLISETSSSTASILTPLINSSTDGSIGLYGGLQFDYLLQGIEDNNKLKVKYVRHNGVRITLWSSEDNFISDSWQIATVDFYPSGPFQLSFESTLSPGAETKPYAVLEDVRLQVGALPSIFDCEGSTPHPVTCGLGDLDKKWQRWSGLNASDNGRGPTTDHTLGTSSGHFAINVKPTFDFSNTARMQTPEFHRWTNETACTFRFYYHAKKSGNLEVTVSADSGTDVFPVALHYSETWVEHDIDVTGVYGKYRVTIQVSTSIDATDHIAIDDVQFLGDECRGRLFCWSFPCLNNGVCWQISETDYRCECTKEYEGSDCSINVNECSRDPTLCMSDANHICKDTSPGYQCVCKPGTIDYNGKCGLACTNTSCTLPYEVCLQNDNSISCQCQYGYVESDGKCIKDKSEVESGMAPYTFKVILGTYLGGSLIAVVVAALVVICYFSCCDEDDDWKQDQVEANHFSDADVAGVSGVNSNGATALRSPAAYGGVEMKTCGPESM